MIFQRRRTSAAFGLCAAIVLISMLASLFVIGQGCGNRGPRSLVLAVGGAPSELDAWESLIEQFTSETGIAVTLLRQPTDTDLRRQGLVTALDSRQSDPDVFLMDVAWLGQFAASNWLEPLDPYVEQEVIETEQLFRQVVDASDRYQGRLVALPVYVDGGLLYYRKDLLAQYGYDAPPATWPELVEMAQKVQQGERQENRSFDGFLWQGAQYEGLVCNWMEVAGSAGGGFVIGDSTIKLNTPANNEATTFMHDMIHRYEISPRNTFTEMKEEEVRLAFQRGNALFQRNWPYAWPLHQADDSPVRGKVGIAPLPSFADGQSVSCLGGWHVGMSRFSDMKDEAAQLIAFIVSYETQKLLAMELGWNPARTDVYSDEEVVAAAPHLAELREVFEHLTPRPNLPYYTLISQVLQRELNSVLSGRQSSQDALLSAETQAQKIMEQYGTP